MSDPNPPTTVDEIVVVGQRRREPHQSFPERPQPVDWQGQFDELPADIEEAPDPCANPSTALDWNIDAAAAEGFRRMQQDAGDPLLDSRERSVVIARNPVTGQVYLGNLRVSEPFAGEVSFDLTGVNPAHIVGLMHSHPGSGPYPSPHDRMTVFPEWADLISRAGGNANLLRLYMVGTRTDPGGSARLQIRVYYAANLAGNEDSPSPEVNPDAQPCS